MSDISQLPASYDWLHDSTDEQLDDDGVTATCCWTGPWKDRLAFLTVVAGLPETVTYPGGTSVTRSIPLKYPFYDRVYACRARLRGEGRSRTPTGPDGNPLLDGQGNPVRGIEY